MLFLPRRVDGEDAGTGEHQGDQTGYVQQIDLVSRRSEEGAGRCEADGLYRTKAIVALNEERGDEHGKYEWDSGDRYIGAEEDRQASEQFHIGADHTIYMREGDALERQEFFETRCTAAYLSPAVSHESRADDEAEGKGGEQLFCGVLHEQY